MLRVQSPGCLTNRYIKLIVCLYQTLARFQSKIVLPYMSGSPSRFHFRNPCPLLPLTFAWYVSVWLCLILPFQFLEERACGWPVQYQWLELELIYLSSRPWKLMLIQSSTSSQQILLFDIYFLSCLRCTRLY